MTNLGNKNEATVLFSGGSDCTLATAKLTQEFSKIHLITCHFSGNLALGETESGMKRLQEKFTNTEFTLTRLDYDPLFKKLYLGSYFSDLLKYKLFISNICATCKLAMFTKALEYNIKNNINYLATGINRRSGIIFIDQSEYSIELLDNLAQKYNNRYLTPVYDVGRTDWELYELGVTTEKNIKKTDKAYEGQPGCYFGFMYSIYAHGYFLPRYGQQKHDEISQKYFQEKVKIAESYLDTL